MVAMGMRKLPMIDGQGNLMECVKQKREGGCRVWFSCTKHLIPRGVRLAFYNLKKKISAINNFEYKLLQVESALRAFLAKQAGFSAVRFVPVSGLAGDNLVKRVDKVRYLGLSVDKRMKKR